VALSYVCRRCGARSEVRVKDTALVVLLDDPEWLACPKCHRRLLPAWRAYARAWRRALPGGLLLIAARGSFVLTLLLAWLLRSIIGAPAAAGLGIALAAAIVVGFGGILAKDRVHAVEERLLLVSRDNAEGPQVVGFPCALCEKKIALQTDGETCVCGRPVHKRCMPLHGCAERAERLRL
jgi:hypothetical protein